MKLFKQIMIGLTLATTLGSAAPMKQAALDKTTPRSNDNTFSSLKDKLTKITLEKLYMTLFCIIHTSCLNEVETISSIYNRNAKTGPDGLELKYYPHYLLCEQINILNNKSDTNIGDLLITLSKSLVVAISIADHISSPLCLNEKEQSLITKLYNDRNKNIDSFAILAHEPLEIIHEIFKMFCCIIDKLIETPYSVFNQSGVLALKTKHKVLHFLTNTHSFEVDYNNFINQEIQLKKILRSTKSKLYKTLCIAMRSLFYKGKIGKMLTDNGLNKDAEFLIMPCLKNNKTINIKIIRTQFPYYILCQLLNKLEDIFNNFDTLKQSPKLIVCFAAKALHTMSSILHHSTSAITLTDSELEIMQLGTPKHTTWDHLLKQTSIINSEKMYIVFRSIVNKLLDAKRTIFKDQSDVVKALIFAFFDKINQKELFDEYKTFDKKTKE